MRKIKKILITFSTLLLLTACSSKQLYTLGDTSNISPSDKTTLESIAVEKIELPIYFMDSPIYKKNTPYHLVKVDNANWIHSMDKHLTNVLIVYLQKSLNSASIYPYPWSSVDKIDKKISLTIGNFIAYKKSVNLDANFQIYNKNSKKSSNYLFSTKIDIKDNSVESMIEAMDRAYFELLDKIKSHL
ncbi:MAG TPA: hypothetical protein EYM49_07535 [Campylobacterales bacterium]|nr:hypothetical protein [Campylobacterales bacterium]